MDFKHKEVINIKDGKRLGFVQDVVADLESGTITSIMVARQRIDIITQDAYKERITIVVNIQKVEIIQILHLKESIRKKTMLQNKIKKGQAMQ